MNTRQNIGPKRISSHCVALTSESSHAADATAVSHNRRKTNVCQKTSNFFLFFFFNAALLSAVHTILERSAGRRAGLLSRPVTPRVLVRTDALDWRARQHIQYAVNISSFTQDRCGFVLPLYHCPPQWGGAPVRWKPHFLSLFLDNGISETDLNTLLLETSANVKSISKCNWQTLYEWML